MIAVMVQLATAHTLLRILCACLESLLELQVFALSPGNWPHQPEVLRRMARFNQPYPTLAEAEALLDRSIVPQRLCDFHQFRSFGLTQVRCRILVT